MLLVYDDGRAEGEDAPKDMWTPALLRPERPTDRHIRSASASRGSEWTVDKQLSSHRRAKEFHALKEGLSGRLI